MKITKRFRVVTLDNSIVISGEFPEGSITYAGSGEVGYGFDTEEEKNQFIADNGLIHQETEGEII